MVRRLIHDVPSAAELIASIVAEVERIIERRLAAMLARVPHNQVA